MCAHSSIYEYMCVFFVCVLEWQRQYAAPTPQQSQKRPIHMSKETYTCNGNTQHRHRNWSVFTYVYTGLYSDTYRHMSTYVYTQHRHRNKSPMRTCGSFSLCTQYIYIIVYIAYAFTHLITGHMSTYVYTLSYVHMRIYWSTFRYVEAYAHVWICAFVVCSCLHVRGVYCMDISVCIHILTFIHSHTHTYD